MPQKSKSGSKTNARTKKINLLKLYSEMNKLSNDAVDKEVIKRFKIIIETSEEDIMKKNLELILKDPKNVSVAEFNDNLQPYIKHYLFLIKRDKRNKRK
ncbi:MAG: hypothetical protein A2W19_03420 [Spirochaetes bacterium RBG_16_49_21]|nr:MAG: hypothetical protein A2W19_03420 [Spirochaetes bacterium RBG_16_49_21]